MMRPSHALAGAIILSACMHIAAAALVAQPPVQPGAAHEGSGGIVVSLGPAGRAAGGEKAATRNAELADRAAEQARRAKPVQKLPPAEEADKPPAKETVKKVAKDMVERLPKGPAPKPPAPKMPAPDRMAAADPVKAPPDGPALDLMAGQGGTSGAKGEAENGAGDNSTGGGREGAAADYFATLQAWLEQHKRYPRRAKLRNEQGVVLVRFIVSRAGAVQGFGVEKSSGFAQLDDAAEAMVRRAQPLPPMPAEIRTSQLEIRVPVRFFLH